MAPTRKCKRDEPLVEINVRAGDYLVYEVTAKGAIAKFIITDEEDRVILSDQDASSGGTWTAEWPPVGGWMWDGEDLHAFAGIMLRVTEYKLRVTHKTKGGKTTILRDCTWKKNKESDVAFEYLDVFVAKEAQ